MLTSAFIKSSVLFFCRLGFAGLSPVMPGTCGTFVALVLAPLCFLPLSIPLRVALLAALFLLGAKAATEAETLLGREDPEEVVIDELVGLWLVLLPFQTPNWNVLLAAFVLFRIFDIWKPGPIRLAESWFPAGYGIMIDDVLAGCAALMILLFFFDI